MLLLGTSLRGNDGGESHLVLLLDTHHPVIPLQKGIQFETLLWSHFVLLLGTRLRGYDGGESHLVLLLDTHHPVIPLQKGIQ